MKTCAVVGNILGCQKGRKISKAGTARQSIEATMHHHINEGKMTRKAKGVMPHLIRPNKPERILFCIYIIDQTRATAGNYPFNEFMNAIHFIKIRSILQSVWRVFIFRLVK